MKEHKGLRIGHYAIAILFTVVSLYPIFLMLLSSFKTNIEIFKNPMAFPKLWTFDAYRKLLDQLPYFDYFWNSVFVSVTSVALILISGALVSFYIARFNFKWNPALFFFFLLGMMIPVKLGIVPLFILMKTLGLMNTSFSLIFVYTAIGIPMSVLILVGFFRTLPKELEESGKIDGCSDLGILVKIIAPLMRPALGTVMIMNFITVWNDFFFPLIFIQDEVKKTIPVGMLTLFSEYSTDWSVLFAGLTLSSLPMIILFAVASKQFMEGMTAGAVK
ncbi:MULTISPECIES: carbohydrate ABC transporter permease [Paenibacillus]|jgi:raffinose/stachyose/melibiose transport system permease protein|uniref:Carbohydrate ABC transporter permease n=1 Tax=Paenibacillus baimaensis TaxID=2982185 RepID=A0ABT2UUF8_9BACL|nr:MULTISPECIES: carbohydrate ABC transporter permease [unclassified Paenibacillus]MCU6798287.1 carbohydrate ABC transporter permease [Paenibacillus sp. WQ 127069]OMF03922.1 sugar ABC transporter permease [Paenibacillus sp. FSL H7-0331]